jgi:hypothetical protein
MFVIGNFSFSFHSILINFSFFEIFIGCDQFSLPFQALISLFQDIISWNFISQNWSKIFPRHFEDELLERREFDGKSFKKILR